METINYRNQSVTTDLSADLFALRRNNTGSGNPRDIDATLFQSEVNAGLGYADRRAYAGKPRFKAYWDNKALSGRITDDEILEYFPRQKVAVETLSTDLDNERYESLYHWEHEGNPNF